MHLAVALKVVPRPEEVKVDMETKTLDRRDARSVINPADLNALEMALRLAGPEDRVTIISMGPPPFVDYLRLAIAVGATDAVLLSAREFAGADTLATSYTLAKGVEHLGSVDLLLCGEASSDGGTSQVPPGIAEWLGWHHATYVTGLEVPEPGTLRATRLSEDGTEVLDTALPAVVSVISGCNEPRFLDYARLEGIAKEAEIPVLGVAELGVDPERIGFPGSPTTVAGLREVRVSGRQRRIETVDADTAAGLIYDELVKMGLVS